MLRKTLLLSLSIVLGACSAGNLSPTAYPNEYALTSDQRAKINNVMLATINYDKPGRFYLKRHQQHTDERVANYLKKHDIKLTSNRIFKSDWSKVTREYGDMYDPSTGKRTPAFKTALTATLSKIFSRYPKLDAIVFTDLIETPIQYGNASNRIAQWHGVNRKVKVQGVGEGLDEHFNWLDTVEGISMTITIINRDQQVIFKGIGGIQPVQAIDLHNKVAKFKRRNDLLVNDTEIDEGISLALHPFIIMKNHPGYDK